MAWIENLFQREVTPVLEAGMGFAYQKQLVIANNIANADTPYYRRQTVPEDEFTEALVDAIERRREYHPSTFAPEGKLDVNWNGTYPKMRMFDGIESGPERHDENSVIIEQEMADQAKNELKMSAMQQLFKKHMMMLKDAANKGSAR